MDYNEFVRHFGFSKKSASFPNAKMNPPKRGDADFMIRSRKLNCAADMLEDSLRSKVNTDTVHWILLYYCSYYKHWNIGILKDTYRLLRKHHLTTSRFCERTSVCRSLFFLSYFLFHGFWQVDYMWEDLRKEFVEMDPYGTGFISREEFKDVLTELCVHLSEFEINKLSDKFDLKRDGR